jgi:hypothetical protein
VSKRCETLDRTFLAATVVIGGRVMKVFVFVVSMVLYLSALTTPAWCVPPFLVAAVYNPSNSGDGTTLKGGAGNGESTVIVSCYYPASYNATCQGGGTFDSISNSSCPSLNNFVTVISTSTNCFYRRDFGLNGVVDARQCGVVGDGLPPSSITPTHPDDADLLNKCIGIASTVSDSVPIRVPVVNIGGGVILDNTDDIEIPDDMTLTCGGTSVSVAANNDYRIGGSLSKAIVLNPTTAGDPAGPFTVRLTGRNSALVGCTVVAGAGPNGTENPYSPSIWFPDCKPDSATGSCELDVPSAHTYFRSSMLEASAFNPNPTAQYPGSCTNCGPASQSVGVTIDGAPSAVVRDVAILGFGTCLTLGAVSSAAPGTVTENISGDCNTGVRINKSNAPSFHASAITPLLTGSPYSAWTIVSLTASGTNYQVTAKIGDNSLTDTNFKLRNNDTVWIGTGATNSGQSAIGRWRINCSHDTDGTCTVDVSSCPGGGSCQTFTLLDSKDAAFSLTGQIRNVPVGGLAATAITGLSGADLRYLAAGQTVSDSGSGGLNCIPGGTTVTAVWPLRQIVFISQPPISGSTCASASDSLTFQDIAYSSSLACSLSAIQNGCVFVDAGFRFGDAYDVHNTGGATFSDCTGFEHMVAFHANTGSNKARFLNCATENNVQLPDGSLWSMANHANDDDNDRQNIVGLLVDGKHSTMVPPPAEDADACAVNSMNTIFGQHRPVGIVINTKCNLESKIANGELSVDNVQNNGIGFELDDGKLLLANSGGGTGNAFVSSKVSGSAPQTGLGISNNLLSDMALYMESNIASAGASGCGNKFKNSTIYLCAPSSFTQLPGGRLTLTPCDSSGCYPVMTADATNAGHVYYVPYQSQQVPIYNNPSGVFGLINISATGLTLNLDLMAGGHAATMLYDIFVETKTSDGSAELCTGKAWTANLGDTSPRSTQLALVNGVWVNASPMRSTASTGCQYAHNSFRDCPPFECTYLGTVYMVADGKTAQQFNPAPVGGGAGPCLCLYNAYNHVLLTSKTSDSNSYSYGLNTWRRMDASSGNSINFVDGLAQMQIGAQLTDALKNGGTTSGMTAAMGIQADVGTPATPLPISKAISTTAGTYNTSFVATPRFGYRNVSAIESALGSPNPNVPTFGGSNLQLLTLQVAD